jgi:hypothetical protein
MIGNRAVDLCGDIAGIIGRFTRAISGFRAPFVQLLIITTAEFQLDT